MDPSRQNPFNSGFNPYRQQNTFPRQSEALTDPLSGLDRQRPGGTPDRNRYQTQQEPRSQRSGYTPYRNPYKSRYQQDRGQPGDAADPNQEYRRQDAFEQWKKYQPRTFDPTGDDAFVEELMPGTRR
jgi:hypothetical protein